MADSVTIGVTGPDRGGLMAWAMTAWAIRRRGGTPIRITPQQPCDNTRLRGLIIGGGSDVDPFHYGEAGPQTAPDTADQHNSLVDWTIGLVLNLFRMLFASGATQEYDAERDSLETDLIKYALDNDLPVLGICRGAQLMNVVLGGSLHQSIEHFYSEETRNVRSILPRKRILLDPESQLRQILKRESCVVNALHDQSINKLGEGITISATEGTGVIQAIECRSRSYFVGVQWHPEYMPQSRTQKKLFRALVHSATHRQ